MSSVGNIKFSFDVDTSNLQSAFKNVKKEISGIGSTADTASTKTGGFGSKLKEAFSGIGELAKGAVVFKGIDSAIGLVTGSLDGAIKRFDTLNTFPKVLEQIGFSAEDSQKAMKKLSDGIQGLPTTLDGVASSTQRIATMTGDLDGATKITLALNDAFIASGSSSADAERGLQQYVQMLSSGKVDMQSWRTLQETMGVALNDTAKSFGFAGESAQNDLYSALQSGEITFTEFNNRIIELDGGVNGFAERARTASGGIETSFTNMKTAAVKGVTGIIQALNDGLTGAGLPDIAGIFDKMSKGIGTSLGIVAEAVGIVFGFIGEVLSNNRETISGFGEKISEVFDTVANVAIPIFTEAWDKVTEVFGVVSGFVTELFTGDKSISNSVKRAFDSIAEVAVPIFEEAFQTVMDTIDELVKFWDEYGEPIAGAVKEVFDKISKTIEIVMKFIGPLVETTWETIKIAIETAVGIIEGIILVFSGVLTGDWSLLWEGIEKIVSSILEGIEKFISKVFGKIKEIASDIWGKIKEVISNIWEGIKEGVETAINKVKETVEDIWGKIKETTDKVWEGIKKAIQKPIEKARDIVGTAIDKIKGFFNFTFKWPSIPMPEFHISPLGWKIGDLLKGSIPSLTVGWHAKGGIATGPSVVGIGEAGDEAILPLSNKSRMKPFAETTAKYMADSFEGVSGSSEGTGDVLITGNTFVVRQEQDIKKIGEALQEEANKKRKARGRTD